MHRRASGAGGGRRWVRARSSVALADLQWGWAQHGSRGSHCVGANPDEPVTLEVSELKLGGADLGDSLPFAERMGELEERLGSRRMEYAIF
jgi:hypothetical protein